MKGRAARARWRCAALACALPIAASLGPPAAGADGVIWEGNDQSVVLAPQDVSGAPLNDHPASVPPETVERMLAGLRFRYADQEPDAPVSSVFNDEQIRILREAIATGLAKANASEDVTFSIIGAHRLSPGAFARRNRLTAGRVFYQQGRLNLIFGEIQSPYRKKNLYGRIDQDFRPREFGSRSTPAEHELTLLASAPISVKDSRNDWVVFQPDGASGTLPETGPAAVPPPAARDAGPAHATGTPPAARADDAEDIEERLRTLKRLREQQLISEEAYRQKVDEILDDL